jgi:hypothetical protein
MLSVEQKRQAHHLSSYHDGDDDGQDLSETRASRIAHRLLSNTQSMTVSLNGEDEDPICLSTKNRHGSEALLLCSNYTPFVCYSFIVNTVLGVGCLGIPYAMYHAGLVLSTCMILLISFISFVTATWTCETMERYQRQETLLVSNKRRRHDTFPEVVELCRRYLGPHGERLYQFSLYSLGYSTLTAYAQVFTSSVINQDYLKQWHVLPMHAILFFAAIVVPLSCMHLTEQIQMQVVMFLVRVCTLLLMCSTIIWAYFFQEFPLYDTYDRRMNMSTGNNDSRNLFQPHTIMRANHELNAPLLPMINFSGVGLLFSTIVFAQVRSIIAPLATNYFIMTSDMLHRYSILSIDHTLILV